MDDCYLEAGHRGLHFVENRNYGTMVTYRSISKKCFLLKRRDLQTQSQRQLKTVTLLSPWNATTVFYSITEDFHLKLSQCSFLSNYDITLQQNKGCLSPKQRSWDYRSKTIWLLLFLFLMGNSLMIIFSCLAVVLIWQQVCSSEQIWKIWSNFQWKHS